MQTLKWRDFTQKHEVKADVGGKGQVVAVMI